MKLEPCPYCGSEHAALKHRGPWYYVGCKDTQCQAEGPVDLGESGAIEAWNIRHMPPEVAALVEACRVFVTSYEQHYRKEYSKPWEVDCLNCMIAALAPFQEANDGIATE